jgi:hypothetical protein
MSERAEWSTVDSVEVSITGAGREIGEDTVEEYALVFKQDQQHFVIEASTLTDLIGLNQQIADAIERRIVLETAIAQGWAPGDRVKVGRGAKTWIIDGFMLLHGPEKSEPHVVLVNLRSLPGDGYSGTTVTTDRLVRA